MKTSVITLFSAFLLTLAVAGFSLSTRAQEAYETYGTPHPTIVDKNEVEVIEFFNFSCPACFRFQGPFNEWKRRLKPENIRLIRKPVVFERANGLYAKLYFALEAVGMQEEMFQKTFNAIHKDRRLLNSESRIIDWLEEAGIDREKMKGVFNSFSVNAKVKRAQRENEQYGITSTPQMVIAGKYRLSPSDYSSYRGLINDMTSLIKMEGGIFAQNDPEESETGNS